MELPAIEFDTMAFSSFFRKATNFLGLSSPEKAPPLDGEIIFCKNNVCVHPPAALSSEEEHHPGYLNIRSQEDDVLDSTLILTWIPNSTLKKNPRSIENSPKTAQPVTRISPRRSPRQEYAKDISPVSTPQSPQGSNVCSTNAHNGIPPNSAKTSTGSSPDVMSASSDSSSYEGISEKLCTSYKSQTDSGIGHEEPISESYKNGNIPQGQENGAIGGDSREPKSVNSAMKEKDSTASSKSSSPTTEEQLNMLVQNKVHERVKERTSSNRSVSIEMEGDNLVVTTEELDDSPFDSDEQKQEQGTPSVQQGTDPAGSQTTGSNMSTDVDSMSLSSDSTYPSPGSEQYNKMLRELQQNIQNLTSDAKENKNKAERSQTPPNKSSPNKNASQVEKLKQSLDLKLNSINGAHLPSGTTPDISVTDVTDSGSSTPTSGPDSTPPTPYSSSDEGSPVHRQKMETPSPGNYHVSHDMTFPQCAAKFTHSPTGSTPTKSAKDQVCGVFSVDLGQMRSLRLFYSNDDCTSGQLVIASRESQYKILYFHHGGLEKLADCLSDWSFLAMARQRRRKEKAVRYKHFSVIRPYLPEDQSHPEEGAYEKVTEATWKQHMNENGQIEDDLNLRKSIFFAGLEDSVRHEMWPFLLHYYPYDSTFDEREQIRNDKYIMYQNIRKERDAMSEEEKEKFWKTVQCTVEKDVVRTDRSHPFYKGEDNPNLETLKNILLNYAVANPQFGYTQGMSDLLSPVLVEVQREADAYWCFVGLMQRTIFVSSPKDMDMDKQLMYLRELIRIMLPRFYHHLRKVQDGMELLFCHRWILLCFKREFPEREALRMWEACWAHYQTDYFHLFIVLAIIAVYGEDVVQQDLPADEMLLHFSSLSMHMNADVILRKARGLLHRFRIQQRIPCTLDGLCTLCGPGMWDSGHVPIIECVGNHEDDLCPFGGKPPASPKKHTLFNSPIKRV